MPLQGFGVCGFLYSIYFQIDNTQVLYRTLLILRGAVIDKNGNLISENL